MGPILSQRQVSSDPIVVVRVGFQNTAQMCFAMIETQSRRIDPMSPPRADRPVPAENPMREHIDDVAR